jgi:integrase
VFRWGVAQERCPIHVKESLAAVLPLKQGRSEAKDEKIVHSIDPKIVRQIYPLTSLVIKAMLELQLHTGMRPGELCILRPEDIDRSGSIWIYRPFKFKTQYRSKKDEERAIPIGIEGQHILTPFLLRKPTTYCFSPREAMQDIRERTPGQHIGEKYDANSYRKAIHYAIKAVNKEIDKKNKELPENERLPLIPKFNPHQIRHTVATRVWNEYGPEACRALLGHSHLRMSREYAELELARAIKVVEKEG